MNKNELYKLVKKLELPITEYCILSGGSLVMHGIRKDTNDSDIDITKKGIEKIMNDLCTIKISEKELLDTKNFIKGIYLLAHQSVERQAYYLAVREMVGLGYEYDDKYIEELFKVTSDDIIKVANKYLKQKPYKLILMPN